MRHIVHANLVGYQRRGVMAIALIVGLFVLLGAAALVIDRTYVSTAHAELSRAADAAALAAAQRLVYDDQLCGRFDASKVRTAACQAAHRVASFNLTAGEPTELQVQADAATAPDVRIGKLVRGSGLAHDLLEDSAEWPDTVQVIARRTSERGNPLGMLLGRLFGVSSAEVVAYSQATLDDQVVGFAPVGQVAVPVVPLAILARDGQDPRRATWDAAIVQRTGSDLFGLDERTGEVVRRGDGLPEIELVGAGSSSDGAGPNVAVLHLGHGPSFTAITRQLAGGLGPSDLEQFGRSLRIGGPDPLTLCGSPQVSADLLQAFRDLRGKPRVWLLYEGAPQPTPDSSIRVRVVGFVGARVMDVRLCEDGRVAVRVQPCFVVTRSAIAQPGNRNVPRNPYIRKLSLTG